MRTGSTAVPRDACLLLTPHHPSIHLPQHFMCKSAAIKHPSNSTNGPSTTHHSLLRTQTVPDVQQVPSTTCGMRPGCTAVPQDACLLLDAQLPIMHLQLWCVGISGATCRCRCHLPLEVHILFQTVPMVASLTTHCCARRRYQTYSECQSKERPNTRGQLCHNQGGHLQQCCPCHHTGRCKG
jgi:hypothetical protein